MNKNSIDIVVSNLFEISALSENQSFKVKFYVKFVFAAKWIQFQQFDTIMLSKKLHVEAKIYYYCVLKALRYHCIVLRMSL